MPVSSVSFVFFGMFFGSPNVFVVEDLSFLLLHSRRTTPSRGNKIERNKMSGHYTLHKNYATDTEVQIERFGDS